MTHKRIEMKFSAGGGQINPEIMLCKLVIKDSRIPVEHLLCKLSGGMTQEDVILAGGERL